MFNARYILGPWKFHFLLQIIFTLFSHDDDKTKRSLRKMFAANEVQTKTHLTSYPSPSHHLNRLPKEKTNLILEHRARRNELNSKFSSQNRFPKYAFFRRIQTYVAHFPASSPFKIEISLRQIDWESEKMKAIYGIVFVNGPVVRDDKSRYRKLLFSISVVFEKVKGGKKQIARR